MAESFVNTFKRDYVALMDISYATTVLEQMPAAFEHINEEHPHSSLKCVHKRVPAASGCLGAPLNRR